MNFTARLTFALAASLVMGSANAADIAVRGPVYKAPALVESWGGFYMGAGIGFRSSENDVNVNSATDTTAPAGLHNMFVDPGCFVGLPCATGQAFNGTAFRASPYIGYNWQIGRTVLGVEGDFSFADQTTTMSGGAYPATPFAAGGALSNSFSVRTTWDASIRARAGYLIDPEVLLYGTAGPSWIHVETTSNCSTLSSADGACVPGGFAPASITDTQTKLGYTVGGGIEAMLGPNWIARAEYRFSDYGHFSNIDLRTSAAGTQTVGYDTTLRTHTATFGLAYKFGNTAVPDNSLAAYAAMPSAASWTGVYLGAGIGARANQTTATLDKATTQAAGFPPDDLLPGCQCVLGSGYDATAARVSPYVGYNWQFDPKWVVGLEGDFGFANAQSTHSGSYSPGSIFAGNGLNDSYSIRTKWDASVRARLGYVVTPSFMAYVTGGAAWMSVEETSRCDTTLQAFPSPAPGYDASEMGNCAPGLRTPANITQSTVRTGFTIGGGGEMKFGANWIARAEYRYSDFGTARFTDSRSCAGSATVDGFTANCFETDVTTTAVRLQTHTATFGLAYKF
jgi:outer membrane immunogenic protein